MFKSKKLSVVVLAVFFLSVFTGLGTQTASAATYPTDIAGNWASAQITSLINQGVIGGNPDGTFKPNNPISRAEYFTMINRAFNFTVPASIAYSDVKTSDWFYLDIAKARAAGYVAGYPDGTIKPNNNISREEAAVILAQALGLGSSASALSFSDAAKIQSWSRGAVSAVVAAGYMGGYPDGTFKPANSISRAEAAAMIYAGKSRVLVTGVSLNKSSTTVGIDKSETLIATVSPTNATNKTVTWSSSNPLVATVSSSGVVYGKKAGVATITVTTAERSKIATCVVTVKDIVEVTGVTLDESSITLEIDDTDTLEATVEPSDATNKKLIWTSSDEDVATVSSSGKVTAQDTGTCTIKVKTEDGGYYDTCKVTVKDSNGGDLTVTSDTIDMDINDEVTVKVYMPDDYDTSDVDSVDDSDIDGDAEIIDDIQYNDVNDYDNYIKYTIYSSDYEGDATITFNIKIDGDWYTGICDVTVGDSSGGDELTLDDDSIDIDAGDSTDVDVYLPSGYDNGDIDSVSYSTEDSDDVIDSVTHDYDNSDDYVTYTIDAENDVDGSATITFKIKINGDWYYVDLDVNVIN